LREESKSESKFAALSENSSCCVRQNALNRNKRAHRVTKKVGIAMLWIVELGIVELERIFGGKWNFWLRIS
jgi:hypothetical protein